MPEYINGKHHKTGDRFRETVIQKNGGMLVCICAHQPSDARSRAGRANTIEWNTMIFSLPLSVLTGS